MIPRLNNCEGLHASHGSWHKFLLATKLLRIENGFAHFVSSNCHYIVTPENEIVHGIYGFNGFAMMDILTGHETGHWKTLEAE